MYTIKWRKWKLRDFYVLIDPSSSLISLTKTEIEIKKHVNEEIKFLLKEIILENKHKKLIQIDSTTLPGFKRSGLFQFKNEEDIKKSENIPLKHMLNKAEENNLILPAPLCYSFKDALILTDGNHRSAFAKIMNIPIKVQILKPTSTFFKLREAFTNYKKIKNFMDSIKKDSII